MFSIYNNGKYHRSRAEAAVVYGVDGIISVYLEGFAFVRRACILDAHRLYPRR